MERPAAGPPLTTKLSSKVWAPVSARTAGGPRAQALTESPYRPGSSGTVTRSPGDPSTCLSSRVCLGFPRGGPSTPGVTGACRVPGGNEPLSAAVEMPTGSSGTARPGGHGPSPGSAPHTGQPRGKPPTCVCRTRSASGRHTGPRNTAQELLLRPVWTSQEWVPGTDGAAPGHVPAPQGCPTQRSTSNTWAGGTWHQPSAQGSCVDPTPPPREGTSTEAGRRGIPGVSAAPNPQAGPWAQLSGLGCADAAQPHRR